MAAAQAPTPIAACACSAMDYCDSILADFQFSRPTYIPVMTCFGRGKWSKSFSNLKLPDAVIKSLETPQAPRQAGTVGIGRGRGMMLLASANAPGVRAHRKDFEAPKEQAFGIAEPRFGFGGLARSSLPRSSIFLDYNDVHYNDVHDNDVHDLMSEDGFPSLGPNAAASAKAAASSKMAASSRVTAFSQVAASSQAAASSKIAASSKMTAKGHELEKPAAVMETGRQPALPASASISCSKSVDHPNTRGGCRIVAADVWSAVPRSLGRGSLAVQPGIGQPVHHASPNVSSAAGPTIASASCSEDFTLGASVSSRLSASFAQRKSGAAAVAAAPRHAAAARKRMQRNLPPRFAKNRGAQGQPRPEVTPLMSVDARPLHPPSSEACYRCEEVGPVTELAVPRAGQTASYSLPVSTCRVENTMDGDAPQSNALRARAPKEEALSKHAHPNEATPKAQDSVGADSLHDVSTGLTYSSMPQESDVAGKPGIGDKAPECSDGAGRRSTAHLAAAVQGAALDVSNKNGDASGDGIHVAALSLDLGHCKRDSANPDDHEEALAPAAAGLNGDASAGLNVSQSSSAEFAVTIRHFPLSGDLKELRGLLETYGRVLDVAQESSPHHTLTLTVWFDSQDSCTDTIIYLNGFTGFGGTDT